MCKLFPFTKDEIIQILVLYQLWNKIYKNLKKYFVFVIVVISGIFIIVCNKQNQTGYFY